MTLLSHAILLTDSHKIGLMLINVNLQLPRNSFMVNLAAVAQPHMSVPIYDALPPENNKQTIELKEK